MKTRLTTQPGDPLCIWTDGSYLGQHQVGAWAYSCLGRFRAGVLSGGRTTSGRAELAALLEALKASAVVKERPLILYTDYQVGVRALYGDDTTEPWYKAWECRGWRGSNGPVANADMYKALLAEMRGRHVTLLFTASHSGDVHNQQVDRVARSVAYRFAESGSEPSAERWHAYGELVHGIYHAPVAN